MIVLVLDAEAADARDLFPCTLHGCQRSMTASRWHLFHVYRANWVRAAYCADVAMQFIDGFVTFVRSIPSQRPDGVPRMQRSSSHMAESSIAAIECRAVLQNRHAARIVVDCVEKPTDNAGGNW